MLLKIISIGADSMDTFEKTMLSQNLTCLLFLLDILNALLPCELVKPNCHNFRTITVIILVVPIFRSFMAVTFFYHLQITT